MLSKPRVAAMLLMFCAQAFAQSDADRAVSITEGLAKRIGECQRREVVAQFKKEWAKEAWGLRRM
jgi:hypothetical protein